MISVIIPTYKRPKKIVEAVKSVQSQTFKDIEIIVVDDNGLGTKNQVDTMNSIQLLGDSRIVYLVHEKNKGGCAARNTGIKNAKGDYIAFLDDDDVWSTIFLERMYQTITSSDCGAVYCDHYSYDGKYSIKRKNPQCYEGEVYRELLRGWCPASTSLFLVKKDKIVLAGLFDDKLSSFQDYDMWLRLSRITRFCYCNEVLVVKYEGFDEQTSKNPQRRFKGLKTLSQKYDSTLFGEEYNLFQCAKKKFYYSALYNRILYNKTHNIPYKEDKNVFLKKHHDFKSRIRLFMRLHFPKRIQRFVGKVAGIMEGWQYYNGLFPINK